jgi:hypothetical protein
MSNFTFRPAKREAVGLLIGLAGGTGSGKTMSAFRLASGICGSDPFAVIDTEAGRALHYADQFRFDHGDLRGPFTPDAYTEAILAADKAGYRAIIVDSMSHEWAGDGGCLDMAEAELTRMAGNDYQKREACRMASWIRPKLSHKHMVQKLLQVRAHLILCFRAEPKVEMVKEGGKMVVRPKESLTGKEGWLPVCEKNLPFELTASFLLTSDAPGLPKPIKLNAQHRPLFPLDQPINEDSGRRIAIWAAGGNPLTAEIDAADTLQVLKVVFERAWLANPDADPRAALKAAYDARKKALGEPAQPPEPEPEKI